MIEIRDKHLCCGCAACEQCCSKHCITMEEDEEGFLYPNVDKTICINCGLCVKVCPIINQTEKSEPLCVYAAKNRNERQRLESSSGGVFVALAEMIILDGGVVFGAAYDEKWQVIHKYVDTIDDLSSLMRSKYVQSRIGSTYMQCEQFLKKGRSVMFTGTSCQIKGLKHYLRKEYDNLFTIYVICHGAPSPGVWRKYLSEEISRYSARSTIIGKNTLFSSSKLMPIITSINCREKNGFSWEKSGFVLRCTPISRFNKNLVLFSDIFYKNPFMNGFLSNLILRPSCYCCPAKSGRSGSDLTLADYWGGSKVHSDFYDTKGVSLVIVHNLKGKERIKKVGLDLCKSSLDYALLGNPSYSCSVNEPSKRAAFFEAFSLGNSVISTIDRLLYIPLHVGIMNNFKSLFYLS